MKGINEFTADQLRHWNNQIETVDGWKMARPIGRGVFMCRIKKSWKVFIGKADIVTWHRQ